MAKQLEDILTAELPIFAAPRRRGRPSTGRALTAAERKRRQRERDDMRRRQADTYSDGLAEMTTDGLIRELQGVIYAYPKLLDPILAELRARSEKCMKEEAA